MLQPTWAFETVLSRTGAQHCRRQVGSSSKSQSELLHDPAGPLLGTGPRELEAVVQKKNPLHQWSWQHYLLLPNCGNNPNICQRNWWSDKKKVVSPSNETVFGHKKEWSPDTCYNVDEHWKCYAEWKQSDSDGHMLHNSIDMKCPE